MPRLRSILPLTLPLLVFVGGKMLVAPWFHMPVQWSLAIVGSVILISVLLSLKLSARKLSRDTP